MKSPKWFLKWKKQEEKSKKNWKPYVERNEILREIGFANYQDYLSSPLWHEIRTKRLAIQSTCSCCNGPAKVVHHDTYYKKLLLGDDISIKRDLYPLCHACHRKIEFDGERKRSWGETIRVFRRMLFRFKHGKSKSQMIREAIANRKAARRQKRVANSNN